jgi:hypothetical protein
VSSDFFSWLCRILLMMRLVLIVNSTDRKKKSWHHSKYHVVQYILSLMDSNRGDKWGWQMTTIFYCRMSLFFFIGENNFYLKNVWSNFLLDKTLEGFIDWYPIRCCITWPLQRLHFVLTWQTNDSVLPIVKLACPRCRRELIRFQWIIIGE